MPRRLLLASALIVVLFAPAVLALELRIAQLRVSTSRVTATVELRDLLRDKFLDIVQEGRAVFLQIQAELWEERRIVDRLTLTTPALTYRIDRSGEGRIVISDQFGNRAPEVDIGAALPIVLDLGPATSLADDRSYYLRAQVTAATVADRDIEQWGTAIFGDDQSAAGLASLGRFIFRSLLRVGKYLDSASAEVTSRRYTGLQILSGV